MRLAVIVAVLVPVLTTAKPVSISDLVEPPACFSRTRGMTKLVMVGELDSIPTRDSRLPSVLLRSSKKLDTLIVPLALINPQVMAPVWGSAEVVAEVVPTLIIRIELAAKVRLVKLDPTVG